MDSLTNNTQISILVGPTGVGKSEIAVQLAFECGYEIISADAFQVYRGMEIGTAQPTKALQAKVPHHLARRKSWTRETKLAVSF
jgi:tRNA dimethylallyltransferase